jgi:hypothetical protein
MEMTIEKAISHLGTYSSTMGSGQTTQAQHEEAKRVAIDTIRKYQKIEQIAERYEATKGATPKGPGAMMKDIIEIVKGEKE